jgi:heme-degrading monooxygenase HmoA
MFVAVFVYEVDPDRADAFRAAYGPDGRWSALFARAPGYLGTELLRDRSAPHRYLVLDRWESAEAAEHFHVVHGRDYAALSDAHAHLYRTETPVGAFATAVTDGPGGERR